jgi:2-polyprenyl-3-methyl-5-hydroxy-6-metoxy-1,4-benzoquinol methylase
MTIEHQQSMTDIYTSLLEGVKHAHQGYWAPDMDELIDEFSQTRYLKELTKLTSIREDHIILDLGCGNGATSIWLAEEFGCFIHAVDIVEENVNRARASIKHANLEHRICVHRMDATDMEFKTNTFDYVIAVESIYHIEKKESLFQEIRKILKPEGHLLFAEYILENPDSWFAKKIASAAVGSKYLRSSHNYYEMLTNSNFGSINFTDVTEQTVIQTLEWIKYAKDNFIANYLSMFFGKTPRALLNLLLPILIGLPLQLARKKILKLEFISGMKIEVSELN